MRIVFSALMTLVVASAVPSFGFAQVLTPFDPLPENYDQRLDHLVPVAAVSLVGEPVTLSDARIVKDPPGLPFMLGAATLDLRDPIHAKLVFSMMNASEMPIAWKSVELEEVSVVLRPDDGDLFFECSISGRAGHRGTWQPQEKVTVQLPIAPVSNCLKPGSVPEGFLVLVQRADTPKNAAGDGALFRRAFAKLRSQIDRQVPVIMPRLSARRSD